MTGEELIQLELPLFDGVTGADLAGLNLSVKEKTLDPWEILFNQQDQGRDVYFLLSGTLLAVYWSVEGREVIFTRFPMGAYFGEIAALDGGERSLAVVARSAARVLMVSRKSFLDLMENVPQIRKRVTMDLVQRVRSLTAKNVELTTFSVEQRVASFLIRLAVERNCLEVRGVVEDAPTHAEIAASIGANREMVSRTITNLARRGAIKPSRRRIELCDPERLSEHI